MTKKTKIVDVGAFIPHAKKHNTERGGASSASQINRLAQLWQEPDWVTLARQQRYAPQTLGWLAVTYWGLGRAPINKSCFDVAAHEWPALYDAAIKIVRQVFEGAQNESLAELREQANRMAGINKMSSSRERMRLFASGRFGGRHLWPPFTPTPKMEWLGGSMVDLGWPENDACLKACIGVVPQIAKARLTEPQWMVITTNPKVMSIANLKNLTRQDALMAARVEIQKRLEGKYTARALRKAVTKRTSKGDLERVGPDYLQGRDISAQELISTFNFRGLQFGESLSEKEKQRWVNEAFCALHDLARVLGFNDTRWLGLGGWGHPSLALAIGARGHGDAMAHFEPELFVVNLTRDSGAGSLSHEWAHGLDRHLALRTFADGFDYPVGGSAYFTNIHQQADKRRLARSQAMKQFCNLTNELHRTNGNSLYQQALGIEDLKGARKGYWTSRTEMWARSFEAYIEDRLQANGEESPWLVHGTFARDQHLLALSPYPLGDQRGALAVHWRAFISSLSANA